MLPRTTSLAAALALTAATVTGVASLTPFATAVEAHAVTGIVAAAPDGQFADPDSYDVAIAHITDTQYLSHCANGRLPARKQRCQEIYNGMSRWIVDNAASRKIAYTAHTGDIIESYWGWFPLIARGEMQRASEAQAILDDAGMPNGVLPGNHDNRSGADASLYNEFFGPARYAKQPTYAGPWKPGDNSHHVDEFTAGGKKFAVVYLGFKPSPEALTWADREIKARPDTNVIVATHAYLKPGQVPTSDGAELSDDGPAVRKVVDANPNVFLVLSGHEYGVGRNVRQDAGSRGHQVIELMADYQSYSAGEDGKGHAGFIRMLQLDVDGGTMTVDTYSPSLDSFRSRDYATSASNAYDGTEDEFTVTVRFL